MVVGAEPLGVPVGGTPPVDPLRAGVDRDDQVRGFTIRWIILFGFIVLAFVATVVTLNSTVYSAQGFGGSYLASLARHDVAAALAAPGVEVSEDAAADLLTPAALGDLRDIRLVSDVENDSGIHHVAYEYELNGTPGQTEFSVRHTGTRLGFFSTWAFSTSPTSILEITPENDARFEANGLAVESEQGADVTVPFQVLTPGVFSLSHDSTYLSAPATDIFVREPGVTESASVNVQASTQLVERVQTELDGVLEDCVTQKVLQPTGCPFGETITNRIESEPEWSMSEFPKITIVPGPASGTWQVPETAGAAHLVVDVRSLFDGTLSTFDDDVPFAVSYLITFPADGSLKITGQ